MCGIFGGIAIDDPQQALERMASVLRHRGPDEHGFFHEGPVSLGHTRLSIIDLKTGQQPMTSSSGRSVLIFNGEIYNFQEIRSDLEKRGRRFRTTSDTEVILEAYEEWGRDCLSRFNGMFAFAIWDRSERKLWLVRDRVGKKPFCWMKCGHSFYFSSEAKALWTLPAFNGQLDLRAVDQYVQYRYVPSERTLYSQIRKLRAGHWLSVNEAGEIIEEREWWSPMFQRSTERKPLAAYVDEFHSLFASAVKLRMIADVPVGGFLSSGIDSISIGAEMAKNHSRPTFFTLGFGNSGDEVEAASRAARELNAEHHVINLTAKDFELLPRIAGDMDEPYGDPIILPTYLLAREASKRVKVVLTGDGADESMGGYIHHVFFRNIAPLPPFVWRAASALIRAVPAAMLDKMFHYPAGMGQAGRDRAARLLGGPLNGPASYLEFASLYSDAERRELYTPEFRNAVNGPLDPFQQRMCEHFARKDFSQFDKVLRWDLMTWFPEQTLMKFDRLTMQNSIEGRSPYADHRLIEFFLKIPFDVYKLICNNKKIIRDQYQLSRAYLPRKKRAFYLPFHMGFEKQLFALAGQITDQSSSVFSKFFNESAVAGIVRMRESSPLLFDKKILNLVILKSWLDDRKARGA